MTPQSHTCLLRLTIDYLASLVNLTHGGCGDVTPHRRDRHTIGAREMLLAQPSEHPLFNGVGHGRIRRELKNARMVLFFRASLL